MSADGDIRITPEKLAEYTWCDGDIDGYSLSGRNEKGIINDDEWHFIDRMIMQLGIIRRGYASESYREKHSKEISCFDSIETYELLKSYEIEKFR